MSCTVLVGTRDNFTECGLGLADTCAYHRAFMAELPRVPDLLPRTKEEARHGVRTTRSPGPGAVSELGASRTSRASDDSGSDYGTFGVPV